MDSNYLTPDELRAIAEAVESLNPLWDALTAGAGAGISLDTDEVSLNVYDSNGEKLGIITWADAGPAFYPAGLTVD